MGASQALDAGSIPVSRSKFHGEAFQRAEPMSRAPANMLASVERVARFIETLDSSHLAKAFAAKDVAILENFAPYAFTGPGAAVRWQKHFRLHARGLSGLRHSFGAPHDFSVDGKHAYF